MTDALADPRVATWGSALAVLAVLLLGALLAARLRVDEMPHSSRLVAAALLILAVTVSGFAVKALSNAWMPPDTRVEPGLMWRWAPGVLAVLGTVLLVRLRRRSQAP